MPEPLNPHGQPINRRLNAERLTERVLDELIGLARGVIADGSIAESEARFLADWLARNRAVADSWPASILYERVREMLADGALDPAEQAELLDTLHELVGTGALPADAASSSSGLPLDQPQPLILFESRVFCFTGKFVHGTRSECQSAVSSRGAITQSSPTGETHYLVIGAVGSRDWIHSSYGRKIEKAVALRSEGRPLAIVSEPHWVTALSA